MGIFKGGRNEQNIHLFLFGARFFSFEGFALTVLLFPFKFPWSNISDFDLVVTCIFFNITEFVKPEDSFLGRNSLIKKRRWS